MVAALTRAVCSVALLRIFVRAAAHPRQGNTSTQPHYIKVQHSSRVM
jgi:hypothetical protein